MQSVGQRHTLPEMVVRKIAHGLGFRFRLHSKTLPGTPDLCFPKFKKVVFVNGCFWHGHSKCPKGKLPKSRLDYWEPKILRNKRRDREAIRKLRRLGWSSLVVWQCQTRNPATLALRLQKFLEPKEKTDRHSDAGSV